MLRLLYINFLHTHFLLINTVLSQQMSWLDLLNQCICQTVHLVPALHNVFHVTLAYEMTLGFCFNRNISTFADLSTAWFSLCALGKVVSQPLGPLWGRNYLSHSGVATANHFTAIRHQVY